MQLKRLNGQVDKLVAKVKHYLITRWGKLPEQVSDSEFYEAFSLALREEVMINWSAAYSTYQKKNVRYVYYISMEYLPGKILEDTIKNLEIEELCKEVITKFNRDYAHTLHLEREPGLGNGGLGRLASCYLDSLATLKIPAIGYGLRYQYGTFEQEICFGEQVERPDRWLNYPFPWEFRRDNNAYNIKLGGTTSEFNNKSGEKCLNLHDYEEIRAIAFDIPIVGYNPDHDFSVTTMRLWSTKESPRNFRLQTFNAGKLDDAAENTLLTDILYPNDNHEMGKRFRLKQEFLLVSSSLQDILNNHLSVNPDLKNLPEKVFIQINDTHPALVIAELMRILTKEHHMHWDEAWNITKECIGFTNHTILSEAMEQWRIDRLQRLLPRQYAIIERLNHQFKESLAKKNIVGDHFIKYSIIGSEQVKMAHLAIYGSKYINGVAKLHSEILIEHTFNDFYKLWPEKFLNVTNGVTPRRWLINLNSGLKEFLINKIGTSWLTELKDLEKLHSFADDTQTQQEFLELKKQNKEHFNTYITNYNNEFRSTDPFVKNMYPLGSDSLFDVHIKRIHEYKRQLLNLLHTIILYQELLQNPDSRKIKRTIILGGKAAPGYDKAKDLIFLTHILARKINNDERVNQKLRLIFIENYNVAKAEILIQASDLSQQISMAGKEASGTGNMKLSLNGSLTIGTDDGANIEMREAITDSFWPFNFGASKDELNQIIHDMSYEPKEIYEKDPKIKMAIDALIDKTFSENEREEEVLKRFYDYLIEGFNPDPYFVLYDLNSYYKAQKKVEDLYCDPNKWAQYALHNIASMGGFSSDYSVKNYAEKIWNVKPQEIDPQILKKVQNDYIQHDGCQLSHPDIDEWKIWEKLKYLFRR